MGDKIDTKRMFTQKAWINAWRRENKKRSKQGKNTLTFKDYKKIDMSKLSKEALETAKVAAKAGVKSALSPKKAFLAGTGAGLLPSAAWIAHDVYKAVKKDKKKKRQERKESGTKHLGKAYGGKVNTYTSPRKTTYND